MLPRFETLHRMRPVSLLAPAHVTGEEGTLDLAAGRLADARPAGAGLALPAAAPSVAVVATLGPGGGDGGRVEPALLLGGWRLAGSFDPRTRRTEVVLTPPTGRPVSLRSRRHGRATRHPTHLGLTLTGPWLTLLAHDDDAWRVHARADLREHAGAPDVHDAAALAGLRVALVHDGQVRRLRAGAFGQLGLRDVRFVTDADGVPLRAGRRFWLTATHAGPGFADAAHAGVWLLDPESGEAEHTADLFLRRPSPSRPSPSRPSPSRPSEAAGVHGDHAVHLLRDGDTWLLAATTWDELGPDPRRLPPPAGAVGCLLARTGTDPRRGRHILDAEPLRLPAGAGTVASWDPHLLRDRDAGDGGGWLVAFVEATRWFRFHPALAAGPALDRLAHRAADGSRAATEGVTLARLGGPGAPVRVLVSDGPGSAPPRRRCFTALDLQLRPLGHLDADYPSNIPWPTIARDGDRWWLVTFDGTAYGGPLTGHGTHGDLIVARSV